MHIMSKLYPSFLDEATAARFGLQGRKVQPMVFETTVGNKTVYCCLSRSRFDDRGLDFSPVGKAALAALMAIPAKEPTALLVQELTIGLAPLKKQVESAFRRVKAGGKICFVTDVAGTLDGELLLLLGISRRALRNQTKQAPT